MQVIQSVDFANWQLNPYPAHREGTLSYYVILGAIGFVRLIGFIQAMPNTLTGYPPDFANALWTARCVTAFFDVLSVGLVYLVLKNLCRGRTGPMVGAFIFAILPFEIIYAHYMRSHTFANFFVLTAIFLSTFLYETEDLRLYPYIGIACGLATASKYPAGIVVAVPFLILLAKSVANGLPKSELPRRAWALLREKRTWVIFGFLFLTFFLVDPFLFLAYREAKPHIEFQASFTAKQEFTLLKLFDLSRLWDYIKYLIPYGTLPYLWSLLYAAIAYLFFRPKLYLRVLPLFIFSMLFFYPMAKGYVVPMFIRATLTLFPLFALFVGLAWDDLIPRLKLWETRGVAWLVLAAVCAPTIAYDWAYVTAMRKKDPRVRIYDFLEPEATAAKPLQVGLYQSDYGYFTTRPVLELLLAEKRLDFISIEDLAQQATKIDYILLSAFESTDYPTAATRLAALEKEGHFKLAETFETPIEFFGHRFQFPRNPHDLVYPFPTLYLLKADAR
jgi:hypothetical protein